MLTKQALHFPSIPCTTNFTVPTSIWAVCLYITCCPFNTFTLAASFHFCLYWFNLLIACCIGFHSVFFLCPCVYVHVSTYCVCMWSFRCFSTLGFERNTLRLADQPVTIKFTDPTAHQLTRQAHQQASGSSWCWGSAGHYHTQVLLGRWDQT